MTGPVCGLIAAVLFGVGAPIAKSLVDDAGPVALACVFYLSAAVALTMVRSASTADEAPLRGADIPMLLAVAALGGIVGPVLMLYGLARVSGVTGSLLLNLEAPFTMLIAVTVFGEHLGSRELAAAGVIVAGATLLGTAPASVTDTNGSVLAIPALAGACLAWGVDNNLTQRLSVRDPVALARIKAFAAGIGSLLIASMLGDVFPTRSALGVAITVGVGSYGASIVLDAYALRFIGAAREAAYFATAPFFGAIVAIPLFGEHPTLWQGAAAFAMAIGIAGLLRERHSHRHTHDPITHEHVHDHDEHHQHAHSEHTPLGTRHSHAHTHAPLVHDHAHVSDIHHRHRH